MIALALALVLVAQEADAPMATGEPASQAATSAPAPPPEPTLPTGAPRDDYGLVGWCLGALEGYLAQHDRVMPDVTRIESTYRRPGSSLADDLKVYSDLQAQGRTHMATFTAALQAAEKASLSALRPRGEAAIAKGRAVWAPAANLPTRSVAQQWMGWTLPQACPAASERLIRNATLLGAAFDPAAELIAQPAPEPETPQTAGSAPGSEPGPTPAVTEAAAPTSIAMEPVSETAPLTASDIPPDAREAAGSATASSPQAETIPEAPLEAPGPDGPPALRESPGAQ